MARRAGCCPWRAVQEHLQQLHHEVGRTEENTVVSEGSGTASDATNMAAIEKKITILAGITSSAGTALVSHEYTAQDDHNTASSAAPCNIPTQLRWSARKRVTWVRAKTKTRSKKNRGG